MRTERQNMWMQWNVEDDGVVSDQELQEVQEDQSAASGTQQPDPKGIEASFFG